MSPLLAIVLIIICDVILIGAQSYRDWQAFRAEYPAPSKRTHYSRLLQWNSFLQPTRWEMRLEPRGSVWTEVGQ